MLTVTDLFCGGGGSSTGAIQVPGIQIRMAANHWDLAVEVHNQNHPGADHAAVDLHEEDPRYFPRTDILWASPECTKWSQASGGKYRNVSPEANLLDPELVDEDPEVAIVQRSRLLMFDVLRFAEYHRYAAMVVENVVDIATNPKYCEAWALWKKSLHNLGYDFRVVSLNSMHAQAHGDPAPQSRDRLYIVCWLRGNTPPNIDKVMRPLAWCPTCQSVVEAQQVWKNGRTVGKYRSQYVYLHGACGTTVEPGYLPAAAAIDWSIRGSRIGSRVKPLAEKTRRRIAAGIARYWSPFHMEQGGNQYDAADPKHPSFGDPNAYYRTWSTHDVLRTLHTLETKALVVPLEGRAGDRVNTTEGPLRTQTSRHLDALVMRNNGERGGHPARHSTPASEYLRTLTANGPIPSLIEPPPFVAELRGGGSTARPVTEGDIAAAEAQVDDCLFRMLEPHEVAAGMAFPADYIWGGTRRERVKLCGNAVTPPAARDLIAAVAESLGGAA